MRIVSISAIMYLAVIFAHVSPASCATTAVYTRECKEVTGTTPRPVVTLSNNKKIVCDTQTAGGGWIFLQRRESGDVSFNQTWENYTRGFGDLSGSFWLGLETAHQLTSKREYELRIDLQFQSIIYHAHYDIFRLAGESDHYKLEVSGYSGTAGDSLSYHNMMAFSTPDRLFV